MDQPKAEKLQSFWPDQRRTTLKKYVCWYALLYNRLFQCYSPWEYEVPIPGVLIKYNRTADMEIHNFLVVVQTISSLRREYQMEPPKVNAWKRAAIYTTTMTAFQDSTSLASSNPAFDFDTQKIIKYGNAYQAAWGIFSEYCNNSTIHGIKYLGEQKRPMLERIFWILVFGLSIYGCARLTTNIWNKWDTNPVIVSFAEKSTPVWQIPFPTVTVCPETKTKPKVFNFTDTFWGLLEGKRENMSLKRLEYMEAISQICERVFIINMLKKFKLRKDNDTMNGTSIIEDLHEIAPPFNGSFLGCLWRSNKAICKNIFRKVVTEEGICYSFNSLNPREIYREETIQEFVDDGYGDNKADWDLEEGYKPNVGTDTFPERVVAAGARVGLRVLLHGLTPDYDQLCRGPVQGFKVILHTPGEVAQVSKQYFRIPFSTEVLISIKPKIITTSDELKHYDPSRRQCFFQKERYLRYFKLYTQANCELECLTNFTLHKCECVHFSMPRTIDTPVCGAYAISCLQRAADELLQKEFEQGSQSSGFNVRGESDCNCLPACTSMVYNAEISQADFDHNAFIRAFKSKESPGSQVTRLSIFFKETQFLTSKRSELYGTTDFLANCGGLLGLFMGVSALSIIELVYFCSVRLLTNLKMRQRKRRLLQRDKAPEIVEIVVDNCQQPNEPVRIRLA